MDKIPFEDGVKLKNATVTIQGQEYEVKPAQYSGKTPVSSFNLNKMQDNIENAKAEKSDMEYHGILINQLREKVLNLEDNTEDSGWQTASLTGDFKAYQDNSKYTPRYRKIGKIVEIEGVVSPTKTLTGSGTQVTIFTLPTDFMPSESRYAVCQGSGINRWLLQVNTNGTVTFARYGKSDYTDINAGDWLPFNITYMVD